MDQQAPRPSMVVYERVRDELNTGDLVLFEGTSFFSRLIQRASGSKWSHVGMVMRLPEYDYLALYESTGGGALRDLVSGVPTKGVQLVPLSEKIRTYPGRVAIRNLIDAGLIAEDFRALTELRKELRGRPYEKSALELIRAAHDSPGEVTNEDLSSLFCSELVAEAYQRLGLLTDRKPSNEYTPGDFGDRAGLQLERGHLDYEYELT